MSRFSGTNKKLLKNLSKSGVSTSKRVVKKSTKLWKVVQSKCYSIPIKGKGFVV